MADDKMKNDDLDRNLGGSKQNLGGKQDYGQGQQSPGRSKQDDEQFGNKGKGQASGRDMEDDDLGSQHGGHAGQTGKRGGMGGQNR